MKHGDLSSTVVPRVLIVFEGALGFLGPRKVGEYNRLGSAGKWGRAAACWDFNDTLTRALADLVIRRDVRAEVITYSGPDEFAGCLAERFDDLGVPLYGVTATTLARTVRGLAYAPDIARVYDGDPANWLAYGSKGRPLRFPADLGR